MRIVFGVLSLLIVVAVIGLLSKRQLAAVTAPPVVPGLPASAVAPGATPQQQSQQIQQQVKQAVEGAMQQARPMPEDK